MENIRYEIIKKHPNYIISTDGRVWDKKNNREVEYFTNPSGRKSTYLDGVYFPIDLLMGITFIREQEGYLLRFKDGDINNLNIDNLYWFLPEFEKTINDNGNEIKIPIFTIGEDGEIMEDFETISEASNFFEIHQTSITYSLKNKTFNKAIDGYVCKQEDYDIDFIDYVLNDVQENSYYIVKLNGEVKRYRTTEKILKDYPLLKQTSIHNNVKSYNLYYNKIVEGYICNYNEIEKCKEKAKERYDKKIKKELKRKDKTIYLVDR